MASAYCSVCKNQIEFTPNPRIVLTKEPYQVKCPKCGTLTYARLDSTTSQKYKD